MTPDTRPVATSPRSVVVTGVSTGIGEATARVLAEAGFHVFGSVRRAGDAADLAALLGSRFTPVVFDITDRPAIAAAADAVASVLGRRTLTGLVNNAGIAVPGPLLWLDPDDFRRQIDVNLLGQLIVTQTLAPLLGTDRSRTGAPGRIVMMSSVGGRNASPFMGAYNASKFALEGLSESLRRELMLFGIDVVIVAPGAVATPIWDKAESLDPAALSDTPYFAPAVKARAIIAEGKAGLAPEVIGRAVLTALTSPRPKVRYTITPHPVRDWLVRMLPRRLVDRLVASRLGLQPPS